MAVATVSAELLCLLARFEHGELSEHAFGLLCAIHVAEFWARVYRTLR